MTQIEVLSYQLKDLNNNHASYLNLIPWDLFEHFMQYLDKIHKRQFMNWVTEECMYVEYKGDALTIYNKTSIPISTYAITELRHIEFKSCNIKSTQLPKEIYQLTQLNSLKCINNAMMSIHADIGNLLKLTSLDMSENNLLNLPETMSRLSMLRSLDVSDNCLTELPRGIYHLTNLTDLGISGNGISILSEEMGNWCKLKMLKCGCNTFKRFPENISKLTSLRALLCSNNRLMELPQLNFLTSLKCVYMNESSSGGKYYIKDY